MANPFPGHQHHRGKLAIPYLTADGAPLTMRFRCIEEHDHRALHHGKYMSLPDEPIRMFNVGAIHRAGTEIHVAEGEFDAMVLEMCGLDAVAIPGTQAWRSHHRRMLAGFSRVWIWGDPDEAGAEFVNKITRAVRNASGVRLDQADGDVTDIYLRGGREAVLAKIPRSDEE